MRDEDVPAWWQGLGLPGLVDVHVHFLPPRVIAKVRDYFDHAEEHYGRAWPLRYRADDATLVAHLHAMGVRAFTGLVYPHKPGMAAWLSQWAREFAAATPGCVPSGTFFPEPGAVDYVREAIDAGTRIFKAHVQVGAYDPRDPLLDGVWALLAEARLPAVVHCGSGPLPGRFTGPGPMAEVLARHPRLRLVVAHAGGPEYGAYLDLLERYEDVWLDTTMVGTPFMEATMPVPADVRARYAGHADRIVLGSDYPNIPYAYGEQLTALAEWNLGDAWLRAVCWDNGRRLLGIA